MTEDEANERLEKSPLLKFQEQLKLSLAEGAAQSCNEPLIGIKTDVKAI